MRFVLKGCIDYDDTGGMSNSKCLFINEDFNAEDIETALVVARAMLESAKRRIGTEERYIEKFEAMLMNENEEPIWKVKYISAKTIVTIPAETEEVPSHFEEEIIV